MGSITVMTMRDARPTESADDALDSLEPDVFARNCTSRPVLQNVASRWGILALAALREGPYRFNALRRRVDGVSERMLSQTLQTLERDGLVHREAHHSIPPHVEYTLTDLGAQVAEKIHDLIVILEGNMDTVRAAQAAYHRE